MEAPEESVAYLRLETIGFVLGFVGSYLYVVFVVRGKWKLFAVLLISKVIMLSIGNAILIPDNGATGIALTNILVNAIMAIVSVMLLHREGLLRSWSGLDKSALNDWARTGLFSGGQVFVANLIYMLVVMKMVNDVSQMGDYWLANNFIWGWLIVPVAALGDKLRNEFYGGYRRIWNYLALTTLILGIWLLTVPFWGFFFGGVIGMEDPGPVLDIVSKSVPFYVAYAYSVILQSVLISVGRTDYIFFECLLVNFVYYGVVYGLFLAGAFEASMDFAILMFGFGLVVCLAIDVILYSRSKKLIPEEYQKRDYDGGITQS
jgi:O-antigen/teichoic acid export membrane protein